MSVGSVDIREILGDAHNFGRRVTQGPSRILKPRTLLWEWLLLHAASPLRQVLADEGDFLPDLAFASPHARGGGEVDRVALAPLPTLPDDGKRELADVVGRALALFSWLGLSDLHWENLALGKDARGRVVFAPLDVEMILADLAMPTETKLLPDADPEVALVCQHACGVRRALPYLGKPVLPEHLVTMAGAYRRTLAFLDAHAVAIAEVFANLAHLRDIPIRVLLRGTDEYVRARTDAASLWPPLLEAEAEQLARGDIPYFFRLYGRPGIHCYANAALTKTVQLPSEGDVPQLEPLLPLAPPARALRSPLRKKLREDGLFAVLGAFDHPSFTGRHETDDLVVTFRARTLVVQPRKGKGKGEELETRRDLRAFVSSVYSPCSCGEVREVLVPSVTVCDQRPRR